MTIEFMKGNEVIGAAAIKAGWLLRLPHHSPERTA